VNLRDRKGANPHRSELGIGSVIVGHDEVINFVLMGDARGIGSKEALVNLELPRVLKSKKVSDKRNVNKHVTAEGERAWGLTVERCACGAAHGMHGDCKGTIDQLASFEVVAWSRCRIEKDAEHLGDD